MAKTAVQARQHEQAPQARAAEARRHATIPLSGIVHLKEIATVVLSVSFETSQLGQEMRRRRLALLHRIAANACEGLDEMPIAACDPTVEYEQLAVGRVRIELAREQDYDAAARVLATAYQLAVGRTAVIF